MSEDFSDDFLSTGLDLSYASFDPYEKFGGGCPPTQTPTQKFKIGFSMFSSQEIGSGLVSFQMIFEALQSDLVRFDFHSLRSKLKKIPEFNLDMIKNTNRYIADQKNHKNPLKRH